MDVGGNVPVVSQAQESGRPEVDYWIRHFGEVLNLDLDELLVTTDRREFQSWLGRRVQSHIGGAYIYLPHLGKHAIFIHLERLNLAQPTAIMIVVAEELIHMRDWIDGDRRRHAKHGHDRIAWRVVELTGATIDEVRSALLPRERRPLRFLYQCPTCSREIWRRRRGTWSCGRCASHYDPRHRLRLIHDRKGNESGIDE